MSKNVYFLTCLLVLLPIDVISLCPSGCYCNFDSTCSYYCEFNQCQPQIANGDRCSGHYVHPNECGSISYCDSTTFTCRYQKSTGSYCSYSYECSSGYCDFYSNTCDYSYFHVNILSWLIPTIVGGAVFIIIIIIIAVVVQARRRRMYAASTIYQTARAPAIRSYQGSYPVIEPNPPSYEQSVGVSGP